MSAVKTAGVFDYMPKVCACAGLYVQVWPKHIIIHHLLGQEVATCGLSLITGRTIMDPTRSENVLTVSPSVINAWRISQYLTDFTEQSPFTPLHEHDIVPFLLQGQIHMYPLRTTSRRRVLHAHSVLPQYIPKPISISSSKTLPSINCTHICPQSRKGVTNRFCLLV